MLRLRFAEAQSPKAPSLWSRDVKSLLDPCHIGPDDPIIDSADRPRARLVIRHATWPEPPQRVRARLIPQDKLPKVGAEA
jgi:hypothetical protein